MLYSTAHMLLMLLTFVDPDIIVVQIYQRCLFVSSKEMILFLVVGSLERLD